MTGYQQILESLTQRTSDFIRVIPQYPSTFQRRIRARSCGVQDCESAAHGLGYCATHYYRLRRYGDPKAPRVRHVGDERARFWQKVEKTSGCWIWTGAKNSTGYGQMYVEGRRVAAHRLSYDYAYGPSDPALNMLHHCDNPPCVRPDHLYPGTQKQNGRDCADRGRLGGTAARCAQATQCIRGHPFDDENTYVDRDGHRACRECTRERSRQYRARRRDAALAAQHTEAAALIHLAATKLDDELREAAGP